jgi:hypothetical protein
MRNIWLCKSTGKALDFGSDTNKYVFNQDLAQNIGKTYRIERVIPKRSHAQNRYFWLYLELCEHETGNEKEALHEYVKKYLTPKVERTVKLLKEGQWVEHTGMIGKGTSELTKLEMGEVLDKLCALTDVPLPDPTLLGYLPN